MTLTEFVLERIAEDEATAKAVTIEPGVLDPTLREWGTYADHAVRWGRVRVLAECEAKRRIVESCHSIIQDATGYYAELNVPEAPAIAKSHLLLLALPYADHPDYDESWRP